MICYCRGANVKEKQTSSEKTVDNRLFILRIGKASVPFFVCIEFFGKQLYEI